MTKRGFITICELGKTFHMLKNSSDYDILEQNRMRFEKILFKESMTIVLRKKYDFIEHLHFKLKYINQNILNKGIIITL